MDRGFDSNGSIFVFPDEYPCRGGRSRSGSTAGGDETIRDHEEASIMSRKAEDSANRRYLAASWLQEMVGPLKLPLKPSENEFQKCLHSGLSLCRLLNLIQPGSISRVVESPTNMTPDGALSVYQYFENVRNFVLAVKDLGLPSFEASDLEESSCGTTVGSFSKVIDCILALKSFYEWRSRGGVGRWKPGATMKSQDCGSKVVTPNGYLPSNASVNCGENEDFQLIPDDCKGEDGLNDFKVQSPRSLSNNIRALIKGKKPEDIPLVVEFMLQKVADDYKKTLLAQELQLRKLRNVLREVAPSAAVVNVPVIGGQQTVLEQLGIIKDLRETSENTRHEVLAMKDHLHKDVKRIESQLLSLATTAESYQRVVSENRKLYNEVQDLKGTIRVYCRVKPLPSRDVATVEFIGENGEIMISNPKRQGKICCRAFNFNRVFGPSASQEEVFLDTQPLIRSVLDGYNVCIFAYGQTGSGKTFTMSGPVNSTEELWGVNYRALNDLFHISQSRESTCRYEIGVQMVEIYNEQVRDLLASDGSTKKLEIRTSTQLNVPDASMLVVTSTQDVLELMKCGQKNRSVGATALNERSSRSHSVLTIHVQGKDLSGSILRGCLHLIDLAGSERVNKSEAVGERLKEAQHINKSLSALGDVISALSQKTSHVPYRNSKLTQLLQDSLGGQAKTLMFVHINPDAESYGETISTLKFAERVASTELGAARSNKESAELRDLKEQIMTLKESLSKKDADLDKLQLLRTERREASLQGSFLEKQRRRQSMEEHEARTRKPTTDAAKLREGSPPVRGRRASPPGSIFGYTHGDLDRLLSPSKADRVENKKKLLRPKHSPRSPQHSIEDFAPKSPYRSTRKPRIDMNPKASVFMVDAPSLFQDDGAITGPEDEVVSPSSECCDPLNTLFPSGSECEQVGPSPEPVPDLKNATATDESAILQRNGNETERLVLPAHAETKPSRLSATIRPTSLKGRSLINNKLRRKPIVPRAEAKGYSYSAMKNSTLECRGKQLLIETGISSTTSKRS